jgi:amino acid permease
LFCFVLFWLSFIRFYSILSACNAFVYCTSRIILGMARDGNLPQFFTRLNRFGAPYL